MMSIRTATYLRSYVRTYLLTYLQMDDEHSNRLASAVTVGAAAALRAQTLLAATQVSQLATEVSRE